MLNIKKFASSNQETEFDFVDYESKKDFFKIYRMIKKTKFWRDVRLLDKVKGETFIRYIMKYKSEYEFSLLYENQTGNSLCISSEIEEKILLLLDELKTLKWF